MIAKIGHGTHLEGAIYYNHNKLDQGNASILLMHNMQETLTHQYTVPQLMRSFETNLAANKKTEKPALHISLNPDPDDRISDEKFIQIAEQYMQEMGYGNQPYIVYKHHDIERTHLHIVSINVDRNGRKISDAYEKRRSMDTCRKLEQQFELHPATEKIKQNERELFRPVNHHSGNIKSQIAAVVRYLPNYYHFQTFGTYNALLSLFNITAEQVGGEIGGKQRKGLIYFATNENGEKVSHPFKSSLFGKAAGWDALDQHFEVSKKHMAKSNDRGQLKTTIEIAIHSSNNEHEFKQQLTEQGINRVFRRNEANRIYGITFIDHQSRTVWNGSQLGKNLSANVFNDLWKDKDEVPPKVETKYQSQISHHSVYQSSSKTEMHPLFYFMDNDPDSSLSVTTSFSLLGDLLNQPQGENYEELAFENEMKKRRKGKKK